MSNLFLYLVCFIILLAILGAKRNPLIVGLLLFLISGSYSIILRHINCSWYAIILFLVYIGGLLVLVIYTTLTTSNFQIVSTNRISILKFCSLIPALIRLYWCEILEYQISYCNLNVQAGALKEFIILTLGILLFYIFLIVVFIVCSGGKRLNITGNA